MSTQLSQSVALGWPIFEPDHIATVNAVHAAKGGKRNVEIRIGVGHLGESIVPARVLGHAACVADLINTDLRAIIGNACNVRICIFSSGPKAGFYDSCTDIQGIAALGGALQLCGVKIPIQIDLAAPEHEIPINLKIDIPDELVIWLQEAARNSGNGADPIFYAREHSARSMFADIDWEGETSPLRITIGSAPEGRFWATRLCVRKSSLLSDSRVAPAIALILKSCRVPWYNKMPMEPPLWMMNSPESAITMLKNAANPQVGGNISLSRESRALTRFAHNRGLPDFLSNIQSINGNVANVLKMDFEIGPRLAADIQRKQ